MKQPRLSDDGETLKLDLHGVYVDEAVELVRRVAALGSKRGRSLLRVIHGSSTSDPLTRNRTIKHTLSDVLHEGLQGVASYHQMEDVTLLNLNSVGLRDPKTLTLLDVR